MLFRSSKIFLLFILLAGYSDVAFAQARFIATITPTTIGKDEVAELKLMVENVGTLQDITPPSLNNFTIISGPAQASHIDLNSGNQSMGITYLLKPKAKGSFTIASASARADGKTLQSNSVRIKVVSGRTGNSAANNFPFSGLMPFDDPVPTTNHNDFILKKGESIPEKINKNIFVNVQADKTSCFVGEPVVVTYKLYTRLKSVSNIIKNPAFNGFSVTDLTPPGNSRYEVEKLNGRDYNVYILRRAQLYPLQPGAIELESVSVENDIHFIKEEYFERNGQTPGIFDNFSSSALPAEAIKQEKVTLHSKPMLINVKALPEEKKPASFNGAVGNFAIYAQAEKSYFTTDDAGKFRISILGQGNLTLVNAPEFVWPQGVEAFEPTMKDELNKLSVPMSGSKTFDYAFNIDKEGNYTLPSIDYSFFDPANNQYKTISTKPISISVAKGSGKKIVVPVAERVNTRESFFEILFTKRWLIIAPLALLILTGLFCWLRADSRKQHDLIAAERKEENKQAQVEQETLLQNPLGQTEEMLLINNAGGFYAALNTELHNFLADKLQLTPGMMDKKNIAEELDRSGVPVGMSIAIQNLLEDVSLQLYTPFADETKLQDYYEKAIGIVQSFRE